MSTCLVPVLFTFYIQGVLKLKKNNSGAKGLISSNFLFHCPILELKILLYTLLSKVFNYMVQEVNLKMCYADRGYDVHHKTCYGDSGQDACLVLQHKHKFYICYYMRLLRGPIIRAWSYRLMDVVLLCNISRFLPSLIL